MRAIGVGLICFAASACAVQHGCPELESAGRDPEIAGLLESWVDSRIAAKDYVSTEENRGRLRHPGAWAVDAQFEERFSALAGIEARPILGTEGAALSFFFGRENFQGLVVRGRESSSFGVVDEKVLRLSPRIALMCIEFRD